MVPVRESGQQGAAGASYRTFQVSTKAGITVVRLQCRSLLNDAEIDTLDEDLSRLIATGQVRLALDFASVGYMSSRVVASMVKGLRACQRQGGTLKLFRVQPHIAAAFAITKLERLIEFHLDELSCLRSAWPVVGAEDGSEVTPAPAGEPRVVTATPVPASSEAEVAGEPLHVQLTVMAGRARGHVIPIRGSRFLIGRSEHCNLRAHSAQVSREHAVIEVGAQGVMVADRGSTTGTRLNEEQLQGEPRKAADGDLLEVGPLRFRLDIGRGEAVPGQQGPEALAGVTSSKPPETESGVLGYLNTPATDNPEAGSESSPVRDVADVSAGLHTSGFYVSSRASWDDEPSDDTPVAFRGVQSLSTFELNCPDCNTRIVTRLERLGQEHICPRCEARIHVDQGGTLEVVARPTGRSGTYEAAAPAGESLVSRVVGAWRRTPFGMRITAAIMGLGLLAALVSLFSPEIPQDLLGRAEWVARAVAKSDLGSIRSVTLNDQRHRVADWVESERERSEFPERTWVEMDCQCQVIEQDLAQGTARVACQIELSRPKRETGGRMTGEEGVSALQEVVPSGEVQEDPVDVVVLELHFRQEPREGWLLDIAGTDTASRR